MAKPRSFLLMTALGFLLVSGCATITRGPNQNLRVESTPPGARVQVSNGMGCDSTPCAINMSRRSNVTVTVSRAGCLPAQVQVTHATSRAGTAGLIGNAWNGGFIGVAIDAETGATQDLRPNPVRVDLLCGFQ